MLISGHWMHSCLVRSLLINEVAEILHDEYLMALHDYFHCNGLRGYEYFAASFYIIIKVKRT